MKKDGKVVKKIQVIEMASFIEYQEGSIVSRTVIDKRAGTITFFAFDEGQGLSEHVASYDALVSILDGEAQVVIQGRTFRLREGEMMILPAHKPHALRAVKKFKMMLTMIKA